MTQCALRLASFTFVRPGELRAAEWSEINLEGEEWRIPADRMKMREVHIVPLSRQAVECLRERHPLTGSLPQLADRGPAEWADCLDGLKNGAEVVPLRGRLA